MLYIYYELYVKFDTLDYTISGWVVLKCLSLYWKSRRKQEMTVSEVGN